MTHPVDNSMSARINRLYLTLDRDDEELYASLRRYVARVVNPIVANEHIDEVVQDALVEVWKSLPRFRPTKGATSFSRWVVGVARRRAYEFNRARYQDRHVPISQITESAQDDEGKGIDSFLEPSLDADYESALDAEEKTEQLDCLRSRLTGEDAALVDLIASGVAPSAASKRLGRAHGWARYRLDKMRNNLQSHERNYDLGNR